MLDDSAKAAAIAAYIPFWAKGQVWTYENPDSWNEKFYVKTQNLTLAQAKAITELANKPLFPPSWDEAIEVGAGDRRSARGGRLREEVRRR